MAHNLNGLIQASRINPAIGQGFKNYVVSAASGVRMTDYVVTSITIESANQPGGSTIPPGTELPAFCSLNYNLRYVGGNKAYLIHDTGFAERVALTTGTVTYDSGDGVTHKPFDPAIPEYTMYDAVRVSIDDTNIASKLVTCRVNLANYVYYTPGVDTNPQGAPFGGLGYYKDIPLKFTYKTDPYFAVGVDTGFVTYRIKPYRIGQPTPRTIENPEILARDLSYNATGPVYGTSLYRPRIGGFKVISGIIYTARFPQTTYPFWTGDFNADYLNGTGSLPVIEYTWEGFESGVWVTKAVQTKVGANITNDLPTYTYQAAKGASITVRVKARVISPFTSVQGISNSVTDTVPSWPDEEVFT